MKAGHELNVVDMIRHYDAASAGPGWMKDIEARAALFIELDPHRPGAPYLTLAVGYARDAQRAVACGESAGAAVLAGAAVAAAYQAEMVEALPRWFESKVAPKVCAADRQSTAQAKRRADKPATSDDYDLRRNERIRTHHAARVAEGRHDATQSTAQTFGLSPRQVSRIVSRGRT